MKQAQSSPFLVTKFQILVSKMCKTLKKVLTFILYNFRT